MTKSWWVSGVSLSALASSCTAPSLPSAGSESALRISLLRRWPASEPVKRCNSFTPYSWSYSAEASSNSSCSTTKSSTSVASGCACPSSIPSVSASEACRVSPLRPLSSSVVPLPKRFRALSTESFTFAGVKAVSVPKRRRRRTVCLSSTMPAERIIVETSDRSTPPGCLSGQQTSCSTSAMGPGRRSNSMPPTKAITGCTASEKARFTHFSTFDS
mmetsp:Transcript_31900/g.87824  ORF Transcript_31900/g.87824 Transcript_31900/m.87824 type:complete len:216 (-) Transcript_31900:218-865(-)